MLATDLIQAQANRTITLQDSRLSSVSSSRCDASRPYWWIVPPPPVRLRRIFVSCPCWAAVGAGVQRRLENLMRLHIRKHMLTRSVSRFAVLATLVGGVLTAAESTGFGQMCARGGGGGQSPGGGRGGGGTGGGLTGSGGGSMGQLMQMAQAAQQQRVQMQMSYLMQQQRMLQLQLQRQQQQNASTLASTAHATDGVTVAHVTVAQSTTPRAQARAAARDRRKQRLERYKERRLIARRQREQGNTMLAAVE